MIATDEGKSQGGLDLAKIKQEMHRDWILEEMMKVAMEDERADAEKYRHLGKNAKRENDGRLLLVMAEEERRHLRALQYLFHTFFDKDAPEPHRRSDPVGGFRETLEKSIVNEYSSVSFYRELLCRIPDDRLRMPIRRIMADEQKHAQILEGIMEYK